jgi:hypothetical protein
VPDLRNPVEIMLIEVMSAFGYSESLKLLLEYGREFVGIPRPKGFRRQMARKKCFRNAGILMGRKMGTYCEGFVLNPPFRFPIHHAWITVDGKTAIDVTLPCASECFYFGIPFGGPAFECLHTELMRESRFWPVFLDFPIDKRVIAVLNEMRDAGLI